MTPAFATPDLRQPRTAGALTVYPDDARRTLFYYPPGELTIAVKQDGAPDVHLLHARYTGSAATGDRGATMVRSIFTLRLVMNGPTPLELTAARRELTASVGGAIELRPLPIRRLESAIVVRGCRLRMRSDGTALPAGHVEESRMRRGRATATGPNASTRSASTPPTRNCCRKRSNAAASRSASATHFWLTASLPISRCRN